MVLQYARCCIYRFREGTLYASVHISTVNIVKVCVWPAETISVFRCARDSSEPLQTGAVVISLETIMDATAPAR